MPSSITLSSISAITGAAGLSSIADWTQLTVTQINNMIQTIQGQIDTNSTEIDNLTSTINVYDRLIDVDPGYKALYENADFIYNSTLTQYINTSSLVERLTSTFLEDTRLLSSYSTTASQYLSSLEAARRDYSTLLSTAGQLVPLIQSESSTLAAYTSSFITVSSSCINYAPDISVYLNSTNMVSSVLNQYRSTLTQVTLDYNTLSTSLLSTPTDPILISRVAAADNYKSTIGGIVTNHQSLFLDLQNSYQNILIQSTLSSPIYSTMMGGCDITMKNLMDVIQQTSTNISMYIEISTSYNVGSSAFWSQYTYWSTLEAQANSSLAVFLDQRSTLRWRRDWLAGEISRLSGDLRTKLGTFDTNAATFYSKKRIEIENEVLEQQNAAREWNAYTGLLTSQLMYKKLELFDIRDTLSWQIQSTTQAGDMTLKTNLEGQRTTLENDQASLQQQVNSMNPLDLKFMELDGFFENERIFKLSFIDKRRDLTTMERNVIANPPTRNTIRAQYDQIWADMNTAIQNANTQIVNRNNKWNNEIKTVLDQVKGSLALDPLNKYVNSYDPFGAYFNFLTTQIPQQTKDTMSVTSEYALLPAIDFDKPLAAYPRIL